MKLSGKWRFIHKTSSGILVRVSDWYPNVICQNGKNYIAAWLNGENPVLGLWGAVGTGTTTPLATDTQLQTEIARVPLAVSTRGNNIVLFDFFFTTSQAVGTLKEFGAFFNATATANSGQLLNHSAITEVKVNTNTLTAELQLTVN